MPLKMLVLDKKVISNVSQQMMHILPPIQVHKLIHSLQLKYGRFSVFFCCSYYLDFEYFIKMYTSCTEIQVCQFSQTVHNSRMHVI